MHEHTVFMPLAQLNTTVGGPGTAAAAGPAPGVEHAAPGIPATGPAGATTGASGATTLTSGTTPATNPDAGRQPPQAFNPMSLIWIPMIIVVVYLFLLRPQRKQEQKRKDMMSELKKGDRVMTIGGMIARIVSIEGDEIVLKIDESANVKATYSKKAIQEVLDRDEKK